jgi:hypothetical protein
MIGDEKKGKKNCRNVEGTGKYTKRTEKAGYVNAEWWCASLIEKCLIAMFLNAANSRCYNG